ncbi:MAG: DMT family transporter [Paracoccaceae bacterium]
MTQPTITPGSWIMVLTLGLVWGSTFLLIEVALTGITPVWLAAARIGFAAILTLAVWWARGAALFTTPPAPRDLVRLATIGALSSAVPFMLISWGQQYVTAGFAGISMASVALIVLPLAHWLVPGERMTPRRVVGFVIGFVGVVVLVGPDALDQTGNRFELLGRLACISAAMCYALSSVQMRQLPAINALGLASVTLAIGAVIVVTAAFAIEGPPPRPDPATLVVLVVLGLVPTAGANILRTVVVRTAGPVFMSITNYIVPIVSVLAGAIVLAEPVGINLIWAVVLILCGVGLSQYGAFRRLFARQT